MHMACRMRLFYDHRSNPMYLGRIKTVVDEESTTNLVIRSVNTDGTIRNLESTRPATWNTCT
jgi:hypothetical protein